MNTTHTTDHSALFYIFLLYFSFFFNVKLPQHLWSVVILWVFPIRHRVFIGHTWSQIDKKKTAPGGGTPEAVRRNKTRLKLMFQSPLNIISHRVWFCIPFFLKWLGDIMRKMKNLKGQKFGRLTAISPVAKNNLGAVLWLCECDCGLDTIVEGRSLTSGATRSCGCLDREAHKFRPNRTTHGKSGTRLYRIWKKMKSRCSNPNDPDYQQYYGSRGIIVCPDGLMISKPSMIGRITWVFRWLSIDRIDNEKG